MQANEHPLAVQFRNVRVEFNGHAALQDINLAILTGERVALVGPSGCGKTTFLRAVSGSIPVSGAVLCNGRVSVVYQDLKLLPWLTVIENILVGQENSRLKEDGRLNHWIQVAGLNEKLLQYPYELSGGQRQRVAIIRSLIQNPDILLLDEPFSALDFLAKQHLIELIDAIGRSATLTIIVVSHDLGDALSLTERVLIMRDARLVEDIRHDPGSGPDNLELEARIRSLFEKDLRK
jgi:sulfonate transport system ATP-binding protein